MTPEQFMTLYKLAKQVPPEAFLQFAEKGVYLGEGADRIKTIQDVLNAPNATQEMKEEVLRMRSDPYTRSASPEVLPSPQETGMPKYEMQPLSDNAGFPTVNPAAEDLGLSNKPGGGSEAYLATLLASGLPVSAATGIMPGESGGIPDSVSMNPWNFLSLSNKGSQAMQGLMPQAPKIQYPGMLGSSAHTAQVNMAPIVPARALTAGDDIPTLAQLLLGIRRR